VAVLNSRRAYGATLKERKRGNALPDAFRGLDRLCQMSLRDWGALWKACSEVFLAGAGVS
jgi:hypothetical protein